MDRGLSGTQSRSGRGGEEKYFLTLPGIEPRSSARSLVTTEYVDGDVLLGIRSRDVNTLIQTLSIVQHNIGLWPKRCIKMSD
jgi:hypothetical protein